MSPKYGAENINGTDSILSSTVCTTCSSLEEQGAHLSRTMHSRKFYIIDFTIYGLTDELDVCMYGKCNEEIEQQVGPGSS